MNIAQILLQKAKEEKLGHFYVIEASAPEEQSFKILYQFVQSFVRDYYQKIEGHKQSLNNLMDHPDVYVMGNTDEPEDEKEDKAFTVLDSEALNRFFEFKAVQSKRKFAVITEGHRINTLVANKWLKLLEEPYGNSTIFLLNPRGQKLLDTIHSRAIHLRLQVPGESNDFSEWNSFLKEVKDLPLSQFLENHSRKGPPLAFWVGELIRWESEQNDHPESKASLEAWLKDFQEMETFHQPVATKWALFHAYLLKHVLSRQNH